MPFASPIVITPSLLTLRIASAISLPISASLLAETVATCSILSKSLPTTTAFFLISATTAATALSIPRLRSSGLAPAVTFFRPTLIIACARTVAVVVPSPAWSPVLEATSLTSCAPRFSAGSFNSISLATVTPSLVMCGAPYFLSMTTLRPLGPNVTLTASANWSTPRFSASRASTLYVISFAMVIEF